ncbi:hypothetical protein V1517DRAFT_88739 [Lipomyces orientalis]|uniref:Uncharacterized protein n=1 Tax=Lipomyces orientalis TaxID=1233043 RepID=A0ACC3TR90_9ASCO
MHLVTYFLLYIFAISSCVVAVPIIVHEYDTLCLVQINPTQGAPYNAPGSFWMVVYAELDTVYQTPYVSKGNIIYGKQNYFTVFVPLAGLDELFYPVGVYFYRNDGANGKTWLL